MTRVGFRIFSLSFLIVGFTIYGSAFFTAIGDGGVSAFLSFSRTFVFQIGAVLLLPALLGLTGIWFSTVAAELCSLAVTIGFWTAKKKKYGYA